MCVNNRSHANVTARNSQVSVGVVQLEQREREPHVCQLDGAQLAARAVLGVERAGARPRRARRLRAQGVRQRAVPARLPRAAHPLQGVQLT